MIDLTDIDAFDLVGELLMFASVLNKWDSLAMAMGIRFVCSCSPVWYIHAAGPHSVIKERQWPSL